MNGPACRIVLIAGMMVQVVSAAGMEQERISLEAFNPCGPNALYAAARFVGFDANRERIIELCRVDGNGGCTAADLVRAARAIGFDHAVVVRTTVDELSRFGVPAIIHDNQQNPPHFVAVIGERGEDLLVVNLPRGRSWVNKDRAAEGWDGYAVLLARDPIAGLAPSRGDNRSAMTVLSPLMGGLAIGIPLGILSAWIRNGRP